MEDNVKKLTGRRVFIYIFSFFLVVTAVNVVFITKALESNTGVVNQSPYERGLNYNRVLAENEREKALGWTFETKVDGENLVFVLNDKSGKPISGAMVGVDMVRPVQKGYDFSFPLQDKGNGHYEGKLTAPLKGAWDAYVTVQSGADVFHTKTSLVLN